MPPKSDGPPNSGMLAILYNIDGFSRGTNRTKWTIFLISTNSAKVLKIARIAHMLAREPQLAVETLMIAPLMPFQVRLAVDKNVGALALALEESAYQRFRSACEFAKLMLARSALQLKGRPNYLVTHAGFILSIQFDRVREIFLVVAFDDNGKDPEPPNARSNSLMYKIANLVGFDVGPALITRVAQNFSSHARCRQTLIYKCKTSAEIQFPPAGIYGKPKFCKIIIMDMVHFRTKYYTISQID